MAIVLVRAESRTVPDRIVLTPCAQTLEIDLRQVSLRSALHCVDLAAYWAKRLLRALREEHQHAVTM